MFRKGAQGDERETCAAVCGSHVFGTSYHHLYGYPVGAYGVRTVSVGYLLAVGDSVLFCDWHLSRKFAGGGTEKIQLLDVAVGLCHDSNVFSAVPCTL